MHCHDCSWFHDDAPVWAHQIHHAQFTLLQMMGRLMSQQDEINADVSELQNASQAIQTEITNLEAQVAAGQPVDLTALKTVSDQLAAIVPAAPGDDGSTGDTGATGGA